MSQCQNSVPNHICCLENWLLRDQLGNKVRRRSGVGQGCRSGSTSPRMEGLLSTGIRVLGQGGNGVQPSHSRRTISASDMETFTSFCHLSFVTEFEIETVEESR